MKNLLLILILFNTYNCFAQDNEKTFVPTYAIEKKLFLKKIDADKKKRLKKGETIELKLSSDSTSLYAKIVLWNDNGLFYTPYQEKLDSIHIDSTTEYFTDIVHDTVMFARYTSIEQINFNKNLNFRFNFNSILFTAGTNLVTLPILLYPLIGGGYSNFAPEGFRMIGSGVILIAYTAWRFIQLDKLHEYPMEQYEFFLK